MGVSGLISGVMTAGQGQWDTSSWIKAIGKGSRLWAGGNGSEARARTVRRRYWGRVLGTGNATKAMGKGSGQGQCNNDNGTREVRRGANSVWQWQWGKIIVKRQWGKASE